MKRETIFAGVVCLAIAVGCASVHAATSDGCDKESNNYITAELALCSTHAYNIGLVQNPNNDSDRQLMRDVVALKTTIMTQQMYKQYEYLNATVKRLKMQLEKAILTTKLQAAGAAATNGDGKDSNTTAGSTNRNVVLAGAYDCSAESEHLAAYDCLRRNMTVARNAINSGSFGDVKRQLEKDRDVFNSWAGFTKDTSTVKEKCNSLSTSRTVLEACVNAFGPAISNAIIDYNNKIKKEK